MMSDLQNQSPVMHVAPYQMKSTDISVLFPSLYHFCSKYYCIFPCSVISKILPTEPSSLAHSPLSTAKCCHTLRLSPMVPCTAVLIAISAHTKMLLRLGLYLEVLPMSSVGTMILPSVTVLPEPKHIGGYADKIILWW